MTTEPVDSADMPVNPFNATPGYLPETLAGREETLGEFRRVLTAGHHHPTYFSYLIGERGYGKTALLRAIGQQAAAAQWLVVHVDAAAGRLYEQLHEHLIAAVTELSTKHDTRSHVPMRSCFERLADAAIEREAGVLVAVDNYHAADKNAGRRIGNDIQLVEGGNQDRWISFVAAALPHFVEPDGLLWQLSGFQWRAHRVEVGALSADAARQVLADGYHQAGLTAAENVVDDAAAAANGHPRHLQLIGYHTVEQARRNQTLVVDRSISEAGIAAAHAAS